MKVLISADIEGCCGVTSWSEVTLGHADYAPFQAQMTAEVVAACEGAIAAGAEELLVRDAHGSGRNLHGGDLPRPAKLLRAWSGHPFCMVAGLDESFDAALFVGYHARANGVGNPLAHTFSSSNLAEVRVNDQLVSEYLLHAWAAKSVGVPVVFLSGDRAICDEVRDHDPDCVTVATKDGRGATTINRHPEEVLEDIRNGVEWALGSERGGRGPELPERFILEIRYKEATLAYRRSFFPGAELLDATRVGFETPDCFEMLRAAQFLF